ncbi:MAG: polyketide synthase, partial [Gammaproteobacteria bacterium]|nr:polyketide synthase [Gammaproteobacteria bacterium]
MLSPDGRCKSFDARANGYVRGEGVGTILLKPLSQAKKDNDRIYAVLRGSAEAHGGRAQSLTAPNAKSQADLLIKAYQDADVPVSTVSHIEAHGTGTPLGDPAEIEGLKLAFRKLAKQQGEKPSVGYCAIGTVKTNMGHLEAAAGIVGIIKTALSLYYKQIPGNVHLQEVHPHIRVEKSPFYLIKGTQDWAALRDQAGHAIPRRAGVSSFGF